MTEDVFDKNKQALATQRLDLPKKLTAQNAEYWSEIVSQFYHFNRGIVDILSVEL